MKVSNMKDTGPNGTIYLDNLFAGVVAVLHKTSSQANNPGNSSKNIKKCMAIEWKNSPGKSFLNR